MIQTQGVFHDVRPNWQMGCARGFCTLVYVTKGVVRYEVNKQQLPVRAGEVLYIPHTAYRSWRNDPHCAHIKYTVVFSWGPQSLPPETSEIIQYAPLNRLYYEQRFTLLFTQWVGQRRHVSHIAHHVLSELFFLLLQEKSERRTFSPKENTVRHMQDYILRHFRENISIGELAEIGKVTENYVTVVFREVMGITPIQYMHQIRINTARELLVNTRMTIQEIAEYLGYCDPAYFNRMFKKWTGIPPRESRRRLKPSISTKNPGRKI